LLLTTVIAYALIAFFFLAVESRRGSQSARTFHTSRFDRGSQRVLALGIVAVEAGLIAGPVLTYLGIGRLAYGWIVGWAGVAFMVGGIALRYGAGKTLGVFYTRTLRVQPDQHIATDGPYRIIRHPGYAGTLLLWVGALCATANWPAIVVATPAVVGAHIYRIHYEEAMLVEKFGEQYETYRAHTWRLIPFVY
jgi:protein-S-isoprenylcysteine O-methyltransferase Ste14